MKKALLAIVLAVATLVPIGLSASPASAAGCSTFLSKTSPAVYYTLGEGTWRIQAVAGYQLCTTTANDQYAKMNQYVVQVQRVSSNCDAVTGFRVNPDALGAWDSAERNVSTCNPGSLSFTGVAGVIVWANGTAAQRCISGGIKPKLYLQPDGTVIPIPNICVI
jgi:hypothetical protein